MYFQSLQVWQKAFDLTSTIHILLKSFPIEERYALTEQMRRSSLSIVSNIAEWNGRSWNSEYSYFLSIAKGSCSELAAQILLAERFGYISPEYSQKNLEIIEEIIRMLHGMIKKFRE